MPQTNIIFYNFTEIFSIVISISESKEKGEIKFWKQ